MQKSRRCIVVCGLAGVGLLGSALPAAAAVRDVTRHACPPTSVGPSPYADAGPDQTTFSFEIACLAEAGVALGAGGAFMPERLLTRGQTASLLYRAAYAGRPFPPVAGAINRFPDDDGSVHEDAIQWAASREIVFGYPDGTFRPDQPVRRDQFAAMALRLHEKDGYSTPPASNAFDDDDGSTHERSVDSLAAAGVVSGTQARVFSPAASITRGQAAAVLARLLDLQVEQQRQDWPLPANQLFAVDPAGEQFRDTDRDPSSIDLRVHGLRPGVTYMVVLSRPEDVDGQPPATGPVRFADADRDGIADLRPSRATVVAVNGRPAGGAAAAAAMADADGTLMVTVDNEHPSAAVLVVYERRAGNQGLPVNNDGTAKQPFGASGDLNWFVQASPA